MNQVLDQIYNTSGDLESLTKTASEQGQRPTLADLALALVSDENTSSEDLTKVASDQKAVLENLIASDRAGRAMAHHEFSELEKAASEGNVEPILAFLADVMEPAVEEPQVDERAAALSIVREELARRATAKA